MQTTTSRLDLAPDVLAAAARRVMARCDELAAVSSSDRGITRVYLSDEHAQVNALAAAWMREVGMVTRQDAAGNQLGVLPAADPEAPVVMIGSHLDTVVDAGRYDGIVGVLMGIEVVRLLRVMSDDGVARSPFGFGLEVAAFSDEEGTRFGKALLGSSAVAGTWDDAWWELTDDGGTSLADAYRRFGLDPARVGEASRRPSEVLAYLEAHIEQGPELDRRGEPLAVVSSIASARRFLVDVEGEARHAGGTPYDMRHDALLGAAEAALAVERVCRGEHHMVGTVGQLDVLPGAVNVVPGSARFSIDLRGELDGHRDAVWTRLTAELDAIMGARGLRWAARELHEAPAVFCDPLLQDVVRAGIGSTQSHDPATLYSLAGHDAMSLGAITDVGMLFLRNPDGISHHPDEDVSGSDVALGIKALAEAVAHYGAEPR